MNLPVDFLTRMKSYLGEEYDEFIASYEKPEVKGLRLNTMAPRESLGAVFSEEKRAFLGNEDINVNEIPWFKNGFSYINETIRPGKHPYHEAGAYYIQEPSAMSPAVYLDVKPGERVLDLCAAPGGKSTELGAMLEGQGILISNEIMPDRAKILSENVERMGIKNALVISEDPRNISDKFTGFFDKILVDAPCSGEGMFRRSDIAINEWSLDNVKICAERQAWILDEAAKMLSAGGIMVYSTCTFAKEEDEEQIKDFLKKHDDFILCDMELYGGMREGFDGVGVRLWPHLVDGEGHYVCKLYKKLADEDNRMKYPPVCGYAPDISKKDKSDIKEMFDFFDKNICDTWLTSDLLLGDENIENKNSEKEAIYNKEETLADRRLVKFKDQIYMLPKECPSLNGLKVLRPGLHLGTILKNRFEPGHALAMSLKKEDVKNYLELKKDDLEVIKYYRGETFSVDLPNGWYLILVDGFSMGWGKVTNGIMKNHYPKGLRKELCKPTA